MEAVEELGDVAGRLPTPRVVLMWVPHGAPVDANLDTFREVLDADDVVADCGNSHWEDSHRRHDDLVENGIRFLDIGTSGGISDALGWQGAAFMVGGPRDAVDLVQPLLRDLAVDDGAVFYAGPSPSGHFVKLVALAVWRRRIRRTSAHVSLGSPLASGRYSTWSPGVGPTARSPRS